jgi:hypothetical protein
VDSTRRPGDWRRYGADPTGATDSKQAIQDACNANKLAFDESGGNYVISGTITVPSGVTVRGTGSGTVITCANGGISLLFTTGATGVTVEKIKFSVTGTSTAAYTAPVEFYNSTHCSCFECEMSGCNWAGVLMHTSSYCTVDKCYFHNFQGSVDDSADVAIYGNSSYNTVTSNRCYGGNLHGIMIEDPYTGTVPSRNVIANNRIGQHTAYGILVYMPDAGDSFNQVTGNFIENIQGTVISGQSGAGIYVVGAGAGGTEVSNNTIRNCCIQTSGRTLAPAGIGIAGITAGAAPVSVTGNIVAAMPTYDGILVVSSSGPINVCGNSVSLPSGNSGGTPIRVENSSNVNVNANSAAQPAHTNGRCIFVFANGVAVSQVTVSGNTCSGGNYSQIDFDRGQSGGSFTGIVCSGNNCIGNGAVGNCIHIAWADRGVVVGNTCSANSQPAFGMTGSTNCRIAANVFGTTGTSGAACSGTCTGSFWDKSNFVTGTLTNTATGLTVE